MNSLSAIFQSTKYRYLVLISIYLFSLTAIPFENVSNIFRTILVLCSLPIFIIEKKLIFKDPMLKLLGLALLIQIISWVNALVYLPDIANSEPKLDRLAKLFSFIFIAYWLKGSLRNAYLLWGTLAIGFIIGCFVHADFFIETTKAMAGNRVDFSIKNAQFTSMFSGISLLITAFTLSQLLLKKQPFERISAPTKKLMAAILILALVFFTFITIVTQSRQVWLALAFTISITPIFYTLVFPNSNRKRIAMSYLFIAVIFVGLSQSKIVQQRVLVETSTLQHIVSGDLDNIPMTSIGIRVNSWIAASDWIKERPLLGSDSEAIAQVIQQSDKFTGSLKGFGHLHNYHIETLVAYGLLGLLLIYTLYYWLVRSLFIEKKRQPELNNITIFSLMFVTFWACINFFETFNGRSFGVYTHNIMFAGFYTFYLTSSLKVPVEKGNN
ncbi:O-antigen ligase family protein [Aliivibrio fischeri]|uniref:O-antigen polymerase n=1 Tax=Aliivibrio fischeri SR5 TaxID=1088719 RepID=A0AAV3EX34_ALIFS|nr:O-antigen ligase family protein [Aliivibrio fischeri]EHN71518.1 O-antigen polymerase [Aliivibrio fischeri SR5]